MQEFQLKFLIRISLKFSGHTENASCNYERKMAKEIGKMYYFYVFAFEENLSEKRVCCDLHKNLEEFGQRKNKCHGKNFIFKWLSGPTAPSFEW